MCHRHKEYAEPMGRKNDSHTLNMDAFRSAAADIMNGTAPITPLIPHKDAEDRTTIRRRGANDTVFLVKELQRKLRFTRDQVDGRFGP